MRKRKGLPLDGWVLLDKAEGIGSTKAVTRVRRLLNAQKAGHAGTLDPFASGLLPIALGQATKTIPFMMDAKKTYRFTLMWGIETDSLDRDGDVIKRCDVYPSTAEIEAVLPNFIGQTEQIPPRFSAIKIAGKRAYSLARKGEDFTIKSRKVTIEHLELLKQDNKETAHFTVTCHKGTYVRSLARDIAYALGTLAYVTYLRRTQLGAFDCKGSISLDLLEEKVHKNDEEACIQSIDIVLDGIPAVTIDEERAKRFRQGQSVEIGKEECEGHDAFKTSLPQSSLSQADLAVYSLGKIIGLARYEWGMLSPVRVFITNDTAIEG